METPEEVIMAHTRRDFCFTSLMTVAGIRAIAQQTSSSPAKPLAPISSQAVAFSEISVKSADDGRETRACLNGRTPNVGLEMHQTKLPPGKMPHPPHRHPHDELFLVRTGTVAVTISGKSKTLGPGSYAIITGNDEHSIKNTGEVPAEYFVVALSKQEGAG